MSLIDEYLNYALVGVEERLKIAATGPVLQTTMLAMAVQPGRISNAQAQEWLSKLSRLSMESQFPGKRFRARIAIITSKILGLPVKDAIHLGCFVELIQAASLVHDDVIDEANLRRGRKTVNSQMNNRFAVLTGDYILAQSLAELDILSCPSMLSVFSQVVSQMTFGEAMEIEVSFRLDRSVEHYLATISLKTASLLAFCAYAPCYLVKSDKTTMDALANFGYNLGMAFQIVDDVLDFVGPDGKKIGQDLNQGLPTLPILLLPKNEQLFERRFDALMKSIQGRQTLEKSIALARGYEKRACESLAYIERELGESNDIDMLLETIGGIFNRLPDYLKSQSIEEYSWQTQ